MPFRTFQRFHIIVTKWKFLSWTNQGSSLRVSSVEAAILKMFEQESLKKKMFTSKHFFVFLCFRDLESSVTRDTLYIRLRKYTRIFHGENVRRNIHSPSNMNITACAYINDLILHLDSLSTTPRSSLSLQCHSENVKI